MDRPRETTEVFRFEGLPYVDPEVDHANALIDRLAGLEFAAEINVASSLRVALSVLEGHPAVVRLVQLVKRSPKAAKLVADRLRSLANEQVPEEWSSPHDEVLFALLYVIQQGLSWYAATAAEAVLHAPQTYWASKFASTIDRESAFVEAESSVVTTARLEVRTERLDLGNLHWPQKETSVEASNGQMREVMR